MVKINLRMAGNFAKPSLLRGDGNRSARGIPIHIHVCASAGLVEGNGEILPGGRKSGDLHVYSRKILIETGQGPETARRTLQKPCASVFSSVRLPLMIFREAAKQRKAYRRH